MKKLTLTIAALALLVAPLAFRGAPSLADEIQGAWLVVETTNNEGETTDEQRLEAFRRYATSAGTYTVSGDELSATVMMHRNPNAMAEGDTGTTKVEIDDDVMTRTFTNSEGTQFIVKYERR